MFVQSMTVEDSGLGPDPQDVDHPSWHDIESAICQMDGDQRSIVILNAPGDESAFLGIGGGSDGLYVCFIIDETGSEFRLIDPGVDMNETIEVYMGQTNLRSKQEAVNLDTVIAVSRTYAHEGERDPNFLWK